MNSPIVENTDLAENETPLNIAAESSDVTHFYVPEITITYRPDMKKPKKVRRNMEKGFNADIAGRQDTLDNLQNLGEALFEYQTIKNSISKETYPEAHATLSTRYDSLDGIWIKLKAKALLFATDINHTDDEYTFDTMELQTQFLAESIELTELLSPESEENENN